MESGTAVKSGVDPSAGRLSATEFRFRAMTYNIHGCVSQDRQTQPLRTAAVISGFNANLIALQEVDSETAQANREDHAKILAEALGMNFVCFPVEKNGLHNFGLAILSHYPLQDVSCDWLPSLYPLLKPRKRGVICATMLSPAGPIRVFNTHLSLFKLERHRQIDALLSREWLNSVPEDDPVIFCGDLNAGSASAVYRKLVRHLVDVQESSNGAALPKPTFHSRSPLFRIDHMFISNHFHVYGVAVPRTPQVQAASDHLPLIADLALTDRPATEHTLKALGATLS